MVVVRVVTNMEINAVINQVDRRYAVNTIYDVISNLQNIVPDEEELVAVILEHPVIVVM